LFYITTRKYKGTNWLRQGIKNNMCKTEGSEDSVKTLKNLNANIDVEHAVALAA